MFQFPLLITAHLINTNLEEGMVRSNAIGMGKRGGEKIRGSKGSYNSRTNSNRIEKRIEKEKRQQQPLRIISEDQPRYHGYIFMCNGDTKTDCFKYKVFGLPASRLDVLEKIHPQMKLFLFDFDLRLLYGIFLPASRGEMSLEPTAFGGKFSAQVRFQIYEDCLPLPESVFKPIIRDNYQGSKFRQELSEEHVQNLISLFRPVAMSPSQSVVPLMPAAHSLEQRDEPPGFEVYPRPGAGISASRNQDLAGLHVVHASAVKLHGSSLPTVHDAQPQLRQCYSTGAPPDYFPALPERELYNRYVALPREDQEPMIDRNVVAQAHPNLPSQLSTSFLGHEHLPTKSLSAAYWISVANESLRKEMDPPSHQSTPSASTGMVVPTQCPPLEGKETAMIFQHPQTEIDDSSSAANNVLVGQPPAENCPAHLPTSSSLVLGYWTPVSFQDPNQVYSAPSQRQQVASTGLSTVNIPTSVVQTDLAPGFYSLLETGGNQYVPSRGTTFDYYNYGTKTGANDVPVQVCDSTSYYSGTISVPAQARDPTAEPYTANSSVPAQPGDPAAYYSATTDVPAQAGDLAAYYLGTTSIPAQARDPVVTYYSASIDVPASAGDLAAYYVGTNSVPAQAHDPAVAYYHSNTGIPAPAHDIPAYYSAATGIPGQAHHQGACYYPENLYGHTHLPSSSQAPAYWDSDQVGVAYFPQSILPSGNSSSNVGDGHLNISLAGTATIGPLDGL